MTGRPDGRSRSASRFPASAERRARPRKLNAEDRALWERLAESVRPMPRDAVAAVERPAESLRDSAAAVAPPASERAAAPLHLPGIGTAAPRTGPAHDLAPGLAERLADGGHRLDRRTATRLRRGKTRPEARLDLHGMTLAEAHPALLRFVVGAHERDLRLILVITGKGKARDAGGPLPVKVGVLRHQVPHWLMSGALRPLVARIAPAEQRHGGEGAYYVFLRRRR